MTQERFNSLAIMAIENDFLQTVDFQDILAEFVTNKLKKVNV